MWAENNQISKRQIFRLLVVDLLAISTLILPGTLAEQAGNDGFFCIIVGGILGFLFWKIIASIQKNMKTDYGTFLEEQFGSVLGKLVQLGYVIYFFVVAAYIAYLFTTLILSNLLKEESFHLVLAILVLLLFYMTTAGIEGRARIFEILFWVLLVPLCFMLFFSFGNVDTDYWTPIFMAGARNWMAGSYAVVSCFSISFLLLFFKNTGREEIFSVGKSALCFSAIILAVVYLILQGVFGVEALANMEFPIVTLMSRVQVTGGFLKRSDALMFGIWFFLLFGFWGSLSYWGECLMKKLFHVEKKECLIRLLWIIAIFLGAEFFHYNQVAIQWYKNASVYILTPFVMGVPIILWFCSSGKKKFLVKKKKHAGTFFLLCFSMFFLNGCKTAEIEDRSFPTVIAVKDSDSFAKAWLNKDYEGGLVMDYNHLKVILIERSFFENDASMSEFLTLLQQRTDVPQNAYVLVADDVENIMNRADNMEKSLGEYVEMMMENVTFVEKDAYPTLGMLYQEQDNRMLTLFVPYIEMIEDEPVITSYMVWKRGTASGAVNTDTALLSFFIANQLSDYDVQIEYFNYVRLSEEKNRIIFTERIEPSGLTQKIVHIVIDCEGEILYQKTDESVEKIEENLNLQLQQYFTEVAREALENGVDVSNGYKRLGGMARDWYVKYENSPDFFEKDIVIEFEVKVNWSGI